MAVKFAQHRGEPVVLLTTDRRLVYAPPGPHHVQSPEAPYDIGYFYREDRVYDEDSDAIKELKEYGHILKFVKVLGVGGQGIVALCEVRGPPGKGLEKCVIKMARGPGSQEVHRELLVMDVSAPFVAEKFDDSPTTHHLFSTFAARNISFSTTGTTHCSTTPRR